jgi:hypothetical protein
MKTTDYSGLKMQILARMKSGAVLMISFFMTTAFVATSSAVMADEPATPSSSSAASSAAVLTDMRYGFFNWLDHRSAYGQGAFPEPFLVDDSDLEVNEARLDWLHTQANHERSDVVTAEIEKGFGLLTLEVEVPFEYDAATRPSNTTKGFDNIDLGARYPIQQFVSDTKFVDSTFGVAMEVGIPTGSPLSKDTEVVPKIFNDLKLGNHFTLQSIVGLSMLYGSDEDNGLKTFEYGFVFGYTIPREQFSLPHVLQFIPVFELIGETELNKEDPGHNSLVGNAGFRVNLKTIGRVQPRLGLGYVFPIDNGAREDMHWGVITSLVFEY